MAAITPNAAEHARLPPMASRFVDVAALPWQKTIYAGVCRAGQFVSRPAGSRHEAWAEGGLMIAMFQIPNRFYEKDGREIDFLGNDWKASWGEAYERLETAKI